MASIYQNIMFQTYYLEISTPCELEKTHGKWKVKMPKWRYHTSRGKQRVKIMVKAFRCTIRRTMVLKFSGTSINETK